MVFGSETGQKHIQNTGVEGGAGGSAKDFFLATYYRSDRRASIPFAHRNLETDDI